jgi:anti-sigma factor RsiW
MTGTRACAETRLELGVYVLGSIEAADRRVIDAHLARCAECRDELAELAGLPLLLSRVSADDASGLMTGIPGGDSAR